MRVVVETVDSKVAMKLLASSMNQPQRSLNMAHVNRLAHAMTSGQWQVTHQPIAIEPGGAVIDGQHRLHAVIASNTAQEMLIAYDADPSTFSKIDVGKNRTIADTLAIAGFANVSRSAASARSLLTYDAIAGTTKAYSGAHREVTTEDVVQLMNSPRGDQLALSLKVAGQVVHALGRNGYVTWIATGLTILEESNAPAEAISEYVARLQDGAQLGQGSPILALRRYWVAETGLTRVPGSVKTAVGIATFIKTFNAWGSGESRSITVFKPGIEPMPRVVWDPKRSKVPTSPDAVDMVGR